MHGLIRKLEKVQKSGNDFFEIRDRRNIPNGYNLSPQREQLENPLYNTIKYFHVSSP